MPITAVLPQRVVPNLGPDRSSSSLFRNKATGLVKGVCKFWEHTYSQPVSTWERVWENYASSVNYMLKLRGINQDDLDQYLDNRKVSIRSWGLAEYRKKSKHEQGKAIPVKFFSIGVLLLLLWSPWKTYVSHPPGPNKLLGKFHFLVLPQCHKIKHLVQMKGTKIKQKNHTFSVQRTAQNKAILRKGIKQTSKAFLEIPNYHLTYNKLVNLQLWTHSAYTNSVEPL